MKHIDATQLSPINAQILALTARLRISTRAHMYVESQTLNATILVLHNANRRGLERQISIFHDLFWILPH